MHTEMVSVPTEAQMSGGGALSPSGETKSWYAWGVSVLCI